MEQQPRKDGAIRIEKGISRLLTGEYQVEWRDEYGQRHQKTVGRNLNGARATYAKMIVARHEKRTHEIDNSSPVGFIALSAAYLDKFAKAKKVSWYTDQIKIRKYFNPYFGHKPVKAIKKIDVDGYAASRIESGANGGTVNKEVAILKTIFEKGMDWEYLEVNPCRKFEPYPENPAKTRYLNPGEVRVITDAVETLLARPTGKGWRAFHLKQFRYLIPIAYDTGGRREEMLRLTDADIDMANKIIGYRYRKGKKHEEKIRWVPMTDRVEHILKTMPRDPDTPYLFPDENGRLWRSKKSFYRCLDLIMETAGMPDDVTCHTLRHSYNTLLALNGVDEATRMELMGHTSHVTQARYTHLTNEHKRKAAEILNNVANLQVETFWRPEGSAAPVAKKSEFKSDYIISTN